MPYIAGRTVEALKATLAVGNGIVYKVLTDLGVLERLDGKDLTPNPANLPRIFEANQFEIASHRLHFHATEYCGLLTSLSSVRRQLDWLRDLGIVDWEEQQFSLASARSKAKSRVYTHVDICKLLILLQSIEIRLLDTTEGRMLGLKMFPKHQYGTTRLAYEFIFKRRWNRLDDQTTLMPDADLEKLREYRREQALAARKRQQALAESHLEAMQQAAEFNLPELVMEHFLAAKAVSSSDAYQVYVGDRLEELGFDYLAQQWRQECVRWTPRDMGAIAQSLQKFVRYETW